MTDLRTLDFYALEAQRYAAATADAQIAPLREFLQLLPSGGNILELGCGSGADTRAMLESGYKVVPTDGSPEMARQAEEELRVPVRVMRFDELDEADAYDGVWASACLLHVPSSELTGILSLVHQALKPAGLFYASYKSGSAEGRDTFGRLYNYLSAEQLRSHYEDGASWKALRIEEADGSAYDNQPTRWVSVWAEKLD